MTDHRVWRVVGDPLVTGARSGPLAGLTVAVKDVIAVAGQRIGAGVPGYLAAASPEPRHATAVARLLAAGAAVRGIAVTEQFAYSLAGTDEHGPVPPNPAVPGRIPGGSSSGCASAVALREADLGLATDTAGSVRVPASYQGLWGLRTTYQAVDPIGVLPLAPDYDTVGLLTRDAATLRAAASVLLDQGAGRAHPPAAFAVAPALHAGVDEGVAAAFDAALAEARDAGAVGEVTEVTLPDPAELAEAFRVHQAWQAWRCYGRWISAHPGALRSDVRHGFEVAAQVTAQQDARARATLDLARAALEEALADRTLLLPSTATAAPEPTAGNGEGGTSEGGASERGASERGASEDGGAEGLRSATLRLTCLAGVTGRPAVSAPALRVDGAPLGLCLVGPPDSDLALVQLAATVQRAVALGGHQTTREVP
ncbi:MAG TPA: amidase family protein [Kineosporiaceae bacterium]|nr:amidase family protein [Kineosporiaceae bacterium]